MGTVVAAAATPAAAAPEPGLTVDPQSPAGVEYQIPLDTGRGHGSGGHHGGGIAGTNGGGGGGTGGGGNGATVPVLFGSGITPTSGSGSGSSSGKSGGRSGGATAGAAGGAGAQGSTGAGRASLPPVTASASYSTTGPIAGVVAAILVVGVGLGLFLRRRATRPRRIFS